MVSILSPKKAIPSLAAARLQHWAILMSAYGMRCSSSPRITMVMPMDCDGFLYQWKLVRSILQNQVFSTSVRLRLCLWQLLQFGKPQGRISFSERCFNTLDWGGQACSRCPRHWSPFPHGNMNCLLKTDVWCGVFESLSQLKCLQELMLKELHSEHPGISRMKAMARSHVWWPKLDQDIEDLVKSCSACQSVRQAPPEALLHPWSWPTRSWQRVHINFAGLFQGKMYFLRSYGRPLEMAGAFWIESDYNWKDHCSSANLLTLYGILDQVVSDNGPQFVAEDFAVFMKSNGVKHLCCSLYYPASNGAVERFVRTFLGTR